MQNIYKDLVDVLYKDERLIIEGILSKNKVMELSLNLDVSLLELLLEVESVKKHFFIQLKDTLVFDKVKFINFVNNKNFLPDSFTTFKNNIGLTTGSKYYKENKDVVLAWPYKDCVLEGGQDKEEAKREEIFYNEILAPDDIDRLFEPKVISNTKRITTDTEEEIDEIKDTDNLIIKGNNLLVLHSLKEKFKSSVKLIYIDPPYNTEEDSFNYNDTFNQSTWLTFMKNRLEVARKFLTSDGLLFIQISDKEEAYLKVLCDEVFGKENFLNSVCVKMSHLSGPKMAHKEKKIPKIKEYVLVYANNREEVKLNPEYVSVSWDDAFDRYGSFLDTKGFSEDESEKWEVITVNQALQQAGIDKKQHPLLAEEFKINNADKIFRTARNRSFDFSPYPRDQFSKIEKDDGATSFIYKGEDVLFASFKVKEINGIKTPVAPVGDIWTDIGLNNLSNEGGVSLRFGKKPEALLKRIINMATKEGDLVMDFFMGSGTTMAVAHKMNRRYIGIEQLNYEENDSIVRLKNVIANEQSGVSKVVNWNGGGSFVYTELTQLNQIFIDEIGKATTSAELLDIWTRMNEKAVLSYQVIPSNFEENASSWENLEICNQKEFLIECLDKNNLYVNINEIEDTDYGISEETKNLNKKFYEVK